MEKIFLILKKRLLLSGFLFISFLGLSTAFAIAGTITNTNSVNVTATVGNGNNSGGGGGNPPSVATVVFSGSAFPNAPLTLLKDGSIYGNFSADSNGTFQTVINNLNFGNYQFSIYAQDPQGIISSPYVVNIAAFAAQTYNFPGIVIPPTITSDIVTIETGHTYNVSGYVAPTAAVTLEIPGSQQLGTATADSGGHYIITAHATLPPGIYTLRTRASLGGTTSLYSRPIQVLYYQGQAPKPPPPPTPFGLCVDYNKDRRVNLTDFSILLYWFGDTKPPSDIDCNADHIIDIKDFSLLMYYWTG